MKLTVDQRLTTDPAALARRLTDLLVALARQLNGISEGSIAAVHNAQLTAPTSGTWAAGDFVRNAAPVDDGTGKTIFGWLCVLNGTPGTWLPIGGGAGSGAALTDGDKGDITVSAGGTVFTIDARAVTYPKMPSVTAARLLGRGAAAGAGDAQELTVGTGLSLTGTQLAATGVPVSDGDKGDIVVSSAGAVWTIDSTVLSAFARTLIDDTSAAAARTTLGLAIGTDVQAWDTDLDVLAALARAQGDVIVGGASAWQRLPAGVKRRTLTTRGTGANPDWDAMSVRQATATTFTLADADVGQWLEVETSSAVTATLSTASGYAVGESTIFSQKGAGQLTVAAGSGVRLRAASTAKTRAADSVIAVTRLADESSGTAVFSVFGDTA